ncbi:MAG: Na+/H+ antiporter subunit E [Rhodospirillaceae bacterium]
MSRKDLIHSLCIGALLFGAWLLLSGHYTPFIISLGILSCAAVVWITIRMDIVDHEGHPLHLTWRAIGYWGWLCVEIIKANIDVIKQVLSPQMSISPTMVRVRASQRSDLGQVIYANSITLTPGTISVDVANDEILVHALSESGAKDLIGGEMDRRVTRMAGD